jgi:hypothetical protein
MLRGSFIISHDKTAPQHKGPAPLQFLLIGEDPGPKQGSPLTRVVEGQLILNKMIHILYTVRSRYIHNFIDSNLGRIRKRVYIKLDYQNKKSKSFKFI